MIFVKISWNVKFNKIERNQGNQLWKCRYYIVVYSSCENYFILDRLTVDNKVTGIKVIRATWFYNELSQITK